MRTRTERFVASEPLDDVSRGAHRSRNERECATRDRNRAFSLNEEIATVPPLACDEIVMNVELLRAIRRVAENVADDFQGSACQCSTIRSCEVERPRNVIEVGPTFVPISIERCEDFAFARLRCARMVLGNGRA